MSLNLPGRGPSIEDHINNNLYINNTLYIKYVKNNKYNKHFKYILYKHQNKCISYDKNTFINNITHPNKHKTYTNNTFIIE